MVAMLALVGTGCTSDDYVGQLPDSPQGVAISFDGGTDQLTRGQLQGGAAAEKLDFNFVVYGFKTTSAGTKQVVLDHYNVNYVDGSALTTESNTAGWEYVNQPGPCTLSSLPVGAQQEIKYWDFAATQYDFVAFSAGGNTIIKGGTPSSNQLLITPVNKEGLTSEAYTIEGNTADIAEVYIADRVTATSPAPSPKIDNHLVGFRDAIQFAFHPLSAKVRIGLYETIPGYSVKDVRFYQVPTSASGEVQPCLYAGSQTIPSGNGKVSISFPGTNASDLLSYNKAEVTYSSESPRVQTLTLGALNAEAAPEDQEDGGSIYLGRTSSSASKTTDVLVLPASAGELTLKVDFTLVSIDYNEIINVKGATAIIPAQFASWKTGFAYTYLFKISDAVTNASGQVLYPITFDAIETVDDMGVQQTITTVDSPSITTYAKGELGNEYFVGDHIYVAVTNGTAKLLDSGNAKLYTVSTTLSNEQITEKNISDGLAGITLVEVPANFMTFEDNIAAEDSPTGDQINAISGSNFAKFTAGNDIYVFEYKAADAIYFTQDEIKAASPGDPAYGKTITDIKTPTEYHYKVIRVGNARRPLTLPDIPEVEI